MAAGVENANRRGYLIPLLIHGGENQEFATFFEDFFPPYVEAVEDEWNTMGNLTAKIY